MSELTPLQKAFCKSKAMRRMFREEITPGAGAIIGGYLMRQITTDILTDLAQRMSDNLIADLFNYALHCDDITDAERQEICKFLDL